MSMKVNAHLTKFAAVLLTVAVSLPSYSLTIPKGSFLNDLEPLQNAKYVVTPDDGHEELISAFNSAKKSIYVGIFGISDKNIADGLSAAKKRGVSVTILCDKYCTSNPKRLAIIDQLRADGVDIYTTSTGFTISHWKSFVVDEKLAFISTMNFVSRFTEMRDMGVFVTNPSIVSEVLAVYKKDIENSKNQTAITPKLTQPNLVWSPINSEDKLVELINTADKTIDIWIENMGNRAVHEALGNAIDRKVKVRVLTSQCGMGMPPAAAHDVLKQLTAKGIQVQGVPFPATEAVPYIHAKTITVDNQIIFMGSENFSANSLLKARELGIIFKNDAIQKQMQNLFEKDWSNSAPFPETAPETCSALSVPPNQGGN